ncbi:hypothetical protein ACT4VH_00580 [Acinetobacter baumannii]|nr:hypothetical protein [Acinetobacter baumannii]
MGLQLISKAKANVRLFNQYGLKVDDFSLLYDFESDIYLKRINNELIDLTGTVLVGVTRNTTGSAQTMDRDGNRSVAAANTARKWKVGGRYGLLIEDVRTNYFLNSATPATQTITLPASSNPIVVSCIGSGSVTVTGTNLLNSGSEVTEQMPKAFYPKEAISHTITVTCSQQLTHVQVEIAGGHAGISSPITTGASIVSKPKDTANLNNTYLAEAIGTNNKFTIAVQSIPLKLLEDSRSTYENQISLYSSTTAQILMALNQRVRSVDKHKPKLSYALSNAVKTDIVGQDTSKLQKWGNVTALRVNGDVVSVATGDEIISTPIDAGFIPNVMYLGYGQASPISRAGLHGIITKLVIFPRALSDQELFDLTKSFN